MHPEKSKLRDFLGRVNRVKSSNRSRDIAVYFKFLTTSPTGAYCCHAREKHVRRSRVRASSFSCTGCPARHVVSRLGGDFKRCENVSRRKKKIWKKERKKSLYFLFHVHSIYESFILKVGQVHFFFFFFYYYKLFTNKRNILSFIYIYHYLYFFQK